MKLLKICITLQTVLLIVNSEIIYDSYNYDMKQAVTPLRYDISITLDNDPYDFQYYNGSVRIQLRSNLRTNQLIFHYNQTDGREIRLARLINVNRSEEITDFNLNYFEYENNSYTALELTNNVQMEVNTLYNLHVSFRSNFVEGTNKGFFKNCHVIDGVKRCYAATQFEITHIRETIPCFDEIKFKTYFNVELTHHRSLEAIGNMPVKAKINKYQDSNVVSTIFEQTELMSTYILAFAIGNFNKKEIPTGRNLKINVYTTMSSGPLTSILEKHTAHILRLYENYLQVNYSLPKLDFLIIDGYDIIGMENWGLIIVSDIEFVQDMSSVTLAQDELILNALAHEISHQFFGNLVTIKERRSLFLSEGFATYFASRIAHDINPAEEYGPRNMLVEYIKSISYEQILPETIINNFHPNDTIQETIISYIKGGNIIQMLNNVMGEEAFRQMLVNYMEKYKYGSVTTDDLIEEIQLANRYYRSIPDEVDITEFINSWINQDKFPIVTVTRNYASGEVEISQTSYKQDVTMWWIPFNYAIESIASFNDTSANGWLKSNIKSKIIPLGLSPIEWIIVNKQAAYYYVVKYDETNLNLIAETLSGENYHKIPPIDRAKLIGDLGFLLAMGHKYDANLVKKLLKVMCHDRTFITWSIFQLVMKFWQTSFDIEVGFIFDEIEVKCSKRLYDHYGVDFSSSDLRQKQLVQAMGVKYACLYKYDRCLDAVNTKSLEYLVAIESNRPYYVSKEMLREIFVHGFRSDNDQQRIFDSIQSSSNDDLKILFFSKFFQEVNTLIRRKYVLVVLYKLTLDESVHPLVVKEISKNVYDKKEILKFFTQCLQENCYDFNRYYSDSYTRQLQFDAIFDDIIPDMMRTHSVRKPIVALLDVMDRKYGRHVTAAIRSKYNLMYGDGSDQLLKKNVTSSSHIYQSSSISTMISINVSV